MNDEQQHTLEDLIDEIAEVKQLIMQEGALMMQKIQAIQDAQPPKITLYRAHTPSSPEESTLDQIQAFTRKRRKS